MLMFVPSEAIYADLCEHFSDLVQKGHRARIVLCAPNMLMLAVQTMQAILKDVQMREQAHLIKGEVTRLMDDMGRFRERVLDLQRHFGQANSDIEKILTSSEKIAKRGHRIETLEFDQPKTEQASIEQAPPSPAKEQRTESKRNGGARQPSLLAGE
jgi:DNA recombination protein RmuC